MAEVKRPGLWFAVLCVVAGVVIAAALLTARMRATRSLVPGGAGIETAVTPPGGPRKIFFRHTGLDADYGKLAHVDYGSTGSPRVIENMSCDVVHVSGERGICLSAARGVVTTYSAKLFSIGVYSATRDIPLAGVPTRTRVARNGSIGAATVFVSGHGYASVDFSTQTLLVDLQSGSVIADVEKFDFAANGQAITSSDFNVWGVTFDPEGHRFYATLSTKQQYFLVEGDVASRTARVIHDGVECPSLSPDGTRIAYKKRYSDAGVTGWRLHVLEVATGADVQLAEERSVDDQAEWLDDSHVLYAVPDADSPASSDVWIIAADGVGTPTRFLRQASSPAVLR